MKWIEIQFWRVARWLIVRGYGADCETSDLDDFADDHFKSMSHREAIEFEGRCGSCAAKETVRWIDGHMQLLKDFS